MTRDEILQGLQVAFDEVFLDEVVVTPELSARDVPDWTSLTHVALVVAIEDRFGVHFRLGEVEATQNVGELADLIGRHVNSR